MPGGLFSGTVDDLFGGAEAVIDIYWTFGNYRKSFIKDKGHVDQSASGFTLCRSERQRRCHGELFLGLLAPAKRLVGES